MQSPQNMSYESQIEKASKMAKCKKVLYLYDEAGYRQLLGVFSHRKVSHIKKHLQSKKLLGRLSEFEIRTTEPDTSFNLQ